MKRCPSFEKLFLIGWSEKLATRAQEQHLKTCWKCSTIVKHIKELKLGANIRQRLKDKTLKINFNPTVNYTTDDV